jgi:hypothetical protein
VRKTRSKHFSASQIKTDSSTLDILFSSHDGSKTRLLSDTGERTYNPAITSSRDIYRRTGCFFKPEDEGIHGIAHLTEAA